MGSSTSREQNRETVRQCRDRRNLMSHTIKSLHHLASAQDAYLCSLRHMATSLKMFASGESFTVSEHTHPICVQYPVSPPSRKPDGSENERNEMNVEQTGVLHRNLVEITAAIAECFVKASNAGETALELLENGQKEKKVVHISGLLKVLSSRSRLRKLQDMRLQHKIAGIKGSVEQRNHPYTLQKIFALEKKLYKEIKIRESLKIKIDKKLSSLQRLQDRGNRKSTVTKTRESMNKLQSLLTVAREAVSTTASAIIEVRDSQLTSQILELYQRYFKMWQRMNHFHNAQKQISQQITSLISSSGEETSDLHHAATSELQNALSDWQMTFLHLMKCQRNYNDCIHSWLNRTLYELNNSPSPAAVKLVKLCDEWKQVVDRAPDPAVSQAIKHCMSSIHVIYKNQDEEMRIKRRVGKFKYKLERRSKSLGRMQKKYYKSYKYANAPMKHAFRNYGDHDDYERQALDEEMDREMLNKKKDQITDWLKRVEKENTRHLKAVEVTRLTTLDGVKASLPGVFHAIAGFSHSLVGNLEGVHRSAESMRQSSEIVE